MGLGLIRQGTLFSKEWLESLAHIPMEFARCKIRIKEITGKPIYNPATNSYSPATTETLYDGPARITARRSAHDRQVPVNSSSVAQYQFQISAEEGNLIDLRPKHLVEVYEAVKNQALLRYTYVISDVADSGNPIEQTFWAKVDQEVVN